MPPYSNLSHSPSNPPPFVAPTMTQPFDVEAHLALVPKGATIKGMFWNDLQRAALVGGVKLTGRYMAFNDYPLVDYMRAVANLAGVIHANVSVLEGIRQIGKRAFSTLSHSLTGRVLFAIAGRNLVGTLGLVSQAYERCINPGTARLSEIGPGRAVIELRNIWNFPQAYQIGVFEKVMDHFGHTGTVDVRVLSPCDADYLLQWH